MEDHAATDRERADVDRPEVLLAARDAPITLRPPDKKGLVRERCKASAASLLGNQRRRWLCASASRNFQSTKAIWWQSRRRCGPLQQKMTNRNLRDS
jgi:hypothetical protein